MEKSQNKLHTLLFAIAATGGIPLAALFLFLGVVNLINPDAPEEATVDGIFVGVTLILTAASSIFALFRPFLGGVFLYICSVACAFVFNAFHLSHAILPARQVGYHPFWTITALLVLFLGVLAHIRSRIRRRMAPEEPDHAK